jgi:hypothetical protein
MVGMLGPYGRTHSPHAARRNGKTGQRRGDVELRSYDDDDVQDAAGCRSLVFDLSMTHDRFGSSSHVKQKGMLSTHRTMMRLCVLLRSAKLTTIGNTEYDDNQNIAFLTAIVSTSTRMHGVFCVFFSSFSTGPPGDRGALHCRWNVIAT